MTPSAVVIGVDVGTTSVKAAAVNRAGRVVGEGTSAPIETIAESPGAAEQRPEDVADALRDACLGALDSAGGGVAAAALAMGAQSGSVLAVDDRMAPLSRLLTWMDARSKPVVEGWGYPTIQKVRTISGWSASAGLGLSSIAWLRNEGLGSDARFGPVDAYLAALMTGRFATNPSNAAGVQLMDAGRRVWSTELCALAGTTADRLPDLVASGDDIGVISDEFGFGPSVRLVAGGHDQTCSALALGVRDTGQAFLSAGTAWVLTNVVADGSLQGLQPSFNLSPHVVDGRWTTSTNIGGLGAVVAWALDALDDGPVGEYSPLFVPSLLESDRTQWGRFVGAGRAVLGCVFETCAFEVRRAIESAGGQHLSSELVMVGGGTRNRELVQAIADATNRTVVVRPDRPWPALGAAVLAADALGWGSIEIETADGGYRMQPRHQLDNSHRYERYLELTDTSK
ncbi:MAG: FGGY-family carbohydrate kinase [Acidimicrobiales bacterium]